MPQILPGPPPVFRLTPVEDPRPTGGEDLRPGRTGVEILPRGDSVGPVPLVFRPGSDLDGIGWFDDGQLIERPGQVVKCLAFLGRDGGDGVEPAAEQLIRAAGRLDLAVGGRQDDISALPPGLDQRLDDRLALLIDLIRLIPGERRVAGDDLATIEPVQATRR